MKEICINCKHHHIVDKTQKYGFLKRKTRIVRVHMCSGEYDSITGEVIHTTCERARYGGRYYHGWCKNGRHFEPKSIKQKLQETKEKIEENQKTQE